MYQRVRRPRAEDFRSAWAAGPPGECLRVRIPAPRIDLDLGGPAVSVVMPALNEARNLPWLARRMPSGVAEIILVDGHSTDDTILIAQSLWPQVRIVRQNRRGKGNALACGFAAATGDIIVAMDADGSMDPGEIPYFVGALTQGADYAKGSRFTLGGGSSDITWFRAAGNHVLNACTAIIHRTSFTDLCYGFNAFWRHVLPVLALDVGEGGKQRRGDGFEIEAFINIRAHIAGLKVAEVPSFEAARLHGRSNLRALADGWRVLSTIARESRAPRAAPAARTDGGAPGQGAGAGLMTSPADSYPGQTGGWAGGLLATGGPERTATGQASSRLKVCVVGSGTRFVSGISYYTYFLACALKPRCEVVSILMRSLIPKRWYPGRRRVGQSVMTYDLAAEVPTFDGIDWWAWPSVPRAVSFLRSQRPHVLILQWWSASVLPWYLLLATQAVRRQAAVVLELHEDLDTGEAKIPLVGWFARRGLTALCRLAAILVVHSAWDRDRMSASLGISPEQFRVIPHAPYPIGANPGSPPRVSARRDEPELTVLFFGTIRPYKGLEHLIRAFEQVRQEPARRWKLVVVGETWEGWTLPLKLIEISPCRDDIELVNRYVTDQEAAGFFRRADVVALPYLRSSASGPLAMAQAYGLPVVVTAVGGLVEAVAGYTGAVLVRPGSPDDLARGLIAAAGLRGRTHRAPLTWHAVAQSYADVFAGLAPATTARPGR